MYDTCYQGVTYLNPASVYEKDFWVLNLCKPMISLVGSAFIAVRISLSPVVPKGNYIYNMLRAICRVVLETLWLVSTYWDSEMMI